VRELENVIGHAAMMTTTDMVDTEDLPRYLHSSNRSAERTAAARPGDTLAQVERAHVIRVLRENGGVVSTAAVSLDVPRTTLNALMRRLAITRADLD
jgi:transcriptional regulator with PAS, ATPase and Fis domain